MRVPPMVPAVCQVRMSGTPARREQVIVATSNLSANVLTVFRAPVDPTLAVLAKVVSAIADIGVPVAGPRTVPCARPFAETGAVARTRTL